MAAVKLPAVKRETPAIGLPWLDVVHSYVNPVVALFLGWLLLGEALTPRVLFASGLILGAVALIVASRARKA